jgi:raffinose/stachyose/melibiose transport system substrate-binding protein
MKKLVMLSLVAFAVVGLVLPVFASGGQEAANGEVVLTFPTFWVGQDSKAAGLAELVEEFNAMHEGEIEVVIEPNPDTDGYRDKLNTQLATGSAPDIFILSLDPTTIQYYESDILMDFTDDITGSWREDFQESYLTESTAGGRLKTVPYEIGITPIWYNMNLLNRAGWDAPPATMDEFMQMADDLKAEGIVPTSQMTGGANAWTSMLWYSHILGSLGGPDVWDRPLTDPVYAEAAAVMQQLYSDGNTTRDAVGGDAGVSGGHYLAENTAVFINGPWYVGRIRGDSPSAHQATALAASPQVGDYSGHQVGFLLSNLAAANTDDPAKRAATVEFMRFMTDPDNVQRLSDSSGALFAVKYELGPDADPLQREFVRAASDASFVIGHLQSQFPIEVTQEFGQALAALALGETDPEGFAEMLADANN